MQEEDQKKKAKMEKWENQKSKNPKPRQLICTSEATKPKRGEEPTSYTVPG
jgi:hypothetical protein